MLIVLIVRAGPQKSAIALSRAHCVDCLVDDLRLSSAVEQVNRAAHRHVQCMGDHDIGLAHANRIIVKLTRLAFMSQAAFLELAFVIDFLTCKQCPLPGSCVFNFCRLVINSTEVTSSNLIAAHASQNNVDDSDAVPC